MSFSVHTNTAHLPTFLVNLAQESSCHWSCHRARDEGSSQPKGWIQGHTRIGPVLEITTSYLYGKHGLEIRIWSLSKDNERKWIDIEPSEPSLAAYEVSKKVIHLLRHSQTVQREDDGAVQFWRIKNYLRNQFPQTQYWSDDRWKACLAAGGGAKKEISTLH